MGDDTKKQDSQRKAGVGCLALIALAVLVVMCAPDPEGEEAAAIAPEDLSAAQKAGISAWYDELTGLSSGCDARITELGEAMQAAGDGSGSTYEGYASAKRAQESCETAWQAYGEVAAPEGLAAKVAEEARDTCETSAFLKRQAAAAAMEIFDGDVRPSKVAELREMTESAGSYTLRCAASAAKAITEAGVGPSALSEQ